jgi:hypothetical protein
MNENLRLRWQIAKLNSQIELGRLEQDLNRDTEEGGLIHCDGQMPCRGSQCP